MLTFNDLGLRKISANHVTYQVLLVFAFILSFLTLYVTSKLVFLHVTFNH